MARKTSLKALQTKIRLLQAKADKLRNAEKAGLAELRAVLAKFKLAPADIRSALKQSRSKRGARGIARGSKLKPKYRNSANHAETWAGRGLKPKWLAAAIKKGKKLDDFAV